MAMPRRWVRGGVRKPVLRNVAVMSAQCHIACPDKGTCDLRQLEADRCILWRRAREREREEAMKALGARNVEREYAKASAKRVALRSAIRETMAEKGISEIEAQGIMREMIDGWHAERVLDRRTK